MGQESAGPADKGEGEVLVLSGLVNHSERPAWCGSCPPFAPPPRPTMVDTLDITILDIGARETGPKGCEMPFTWAGLASGASVAVWSSTRAPLVAHLRMGSSLGSVRWSSLGGWSTECRTTTVHLLMWIDESPPLKPSNTMSRGQLPGFPENDHGHRPGAQSCSPHQAVHY